MLCVLQKHKITNSHVVVAVDEFKFFLEGSGTELQELVEHMKIPLIEGLMNDSTLLQEEHFNLAADDFHLVFVYLLSY